MPNFYLGNGDDLFGYNTTPGPNDLTSGSQVYGQNGNDEIHMGSPVAASPSNIFVSGGNGDDTFSVIYGGNNTVDGGNGNDLLQSGEESGHNTLAGGNGNDTINSAAARSNTMDGGRGDDLLIAADVVLGSSTLEIPGNTLTGGADRDTFRLLSGSGHAVIGGTSDAVSAGDVIAGQIDVITDYSQDDRVDLADPATAVGQVGLDGTNRVEPGGRLIELGAGEYAIFRGDLLSETRFEIDPMGHDLLLLYRNATGFSSQSPTITGATAILGHTNPDDILIG